MKFDDILREIGEFGPYQKWMFYLITLPILVSGAQFTGWILMHDIPAYRCAIPEYPDDTYEIQNKSHAWLVNQRIPPAGEFDEGAYSGCQIYTSSNDSHGNISSLLSVFNTLSGRNSTVSHQVNITTQSRRACEKRVFDKTDHDSTFFTEYDWVCGKEIMRSHFNTLDFCGSFLGAIIIGLIADVFGRKSALMIGIFLQFTSALVITLTKSHHAIFAAKFFNGLAVHVIFFIPATTALELVGPNKRAFAGAVIQLYWSAGVLVVLPIAYILRRWRDTELAMALISVPLLVAWWLIPESPRWLLDKKRYAEVEVILQRICKFNKCKLPQGAITEETNDEGPQMSIRNVFTNKVLLLRFLNVYFNWLTMAILYYGLSLNTYNLDGSPYLNYLIGALVEAAGYVFCLLFMHKFPRRIFHCASMIIAGVGCLGVIPSALLGGDEWIATALSMVGRFSASCTYTIIYVISTELFPTVVRNSAMGIGGFSEAIGGMICPYIVDIGILFPGPLGKSLPLVIFGGIGLVAGLVSLLLPETRNRKLPETIQDAVDFDTQESSHQPADTEYELVATEQSSVCA